MSRPLIHGWPLSKYIRFFGFDDYTLNCLNYNQLISGVWCTEAEHKDGYLNVVALESAYNVGDTFEIELARVGEDIVNEYSAIEENLIFYKVKCLVTGIIKGGSYMLSRGMSNALSLSELMTPTFTDKINGEKSVIYFSYEDEVFQDFF